MRGPPASRAGGHLLASSEVIYLGTPGWKYTDESLRQSKTTAPRPTSQVTRLAMSLPARPVLARSSDDQEQNKSIEPEEKLEDTILAQLWPPLLASAIQIQRPMLSRPMITKKATSSTASALCDQLRRW